MCTVANGVAVGLLSWNVQFIGNRAYTVLSITDRFLRGCYTL